MTFFSFFKYCPNFYEDFLTIFIYYLRNIIILDFMSPSQKLLTQNRVLKYEPIILGVFLLMIAGFAILRLVNLRADMPSYITWSNTFFTDEGIYARNASWLVLTGNWYVEGDFNTAINYPIYFVLQVIVFKLFGVNFESVRALSAVSALASIGIVWLIVQRRVGHRAAVVTILLISTNFLFFTFNRYGQADMPMILFVVLSLACLLLGSATPSIVLTALSGFLLLLALLTKTSAAFAIPVILLLVWQQQKSMKARLTHTAVLLSILGLGLVLHRLLLVDPYIVDYQRVRGILAERFRIGIQDIFLQFWQQIRIGQSAIGGMFYGLALITGLLLFIRSRKLRENLLFLAALYWVIFTFLMLSCSFYQPPRYFSHLVIPFSIILGLGLDHLLRKKRFRLLGYLMLGLILLICLHGSFKIIRYISSPQYSVYHMADDIRRQVEFEGVKSPLLIGHIAGNVSLANGMLSVGSHFDDDSTDKSTLKDFPLKRHRPTHFVTQGAVAEKVNQYFQKAGYHLTLIRKYDVLNQKKQVYFYRVQIWF